MPHTIGHNLVICHRCKRKQMGGPLMLCQEDGQACQSHAKAASCPLGLHTAVDPIPLTIGQILHGAKQLVKAKIGVGLATAEIVAERRAICGGCVYAVKNAAGEIAKCTICTCRLQEKTALADEACPHGKWAAANNET